ncbi:alpha/beta hydrolase family protein [Crossiella cryophila]|uniref:Pimeloyl-ACP methyl ester carboxylesterase n=1 Tax=Crossiella cryophila TaxID=43355 RepID=A0A7W7FZB0_9PSEU|nr:prolyl oligopeptidase family serine peptidase [Crossiella cryophila]MBB4680979.1 pimeloyl-ACP methyl ester carboxylesterase [Crossiella cryophila]
MGSRESRFFGSGRRLAVSALALSLAVGGAQVAVTGESTAAAAAQEVAARHLTGSLRSGATYVMDVPQRWNGTVLLFSHGINPAGLGIPNPSKNAVGNGDAQVLLSRGYALIGSSYADHGWVIQDAVPDQIATLATFERQFGKPRRSIAWGESMGGLVTTAIAEAHPDVIDGSLAMCGLVMGGVAEWNAALDATYAFKTLVAPGSTVPLVDIGTTAKGLEYGKTFGQLVDQAQKTPQGLARIALAAALYDVPAHNTIGQAKPDPRDVEAIAKNQAAALSGQVFTAQFLLRADAEQWAGGSMSWNTGVDYASLLRRSANYRSVETLYRRAGISLGSDLGLLASGQRVSAVPAAKEYMTRYGSLTGRLRKPQLNIHTIGDGLVPVTAEQAYRTAVRETGNDSLLRQAYVDAPGHCDFTPGEVVASVETIIARVETNRWPSTTAAALNHRSAAVVATPPADARPFTPSEFVEHNPSPYLRPFTAPSTALRP